MDVKVFDTKDFEEKYFYNGELGAIYTKEKTTFNIWAPTASVIKVVFYEDGHLGKIVKEITMDKVEKGIFTYTQNGDLNGTFYNYKITINGVENEVTDLYAKAVGVNGIRSMVIDLNQTNPVGWETYKRPVLNSPTDAIIYEVHIRDLTIDPDSNIKDKGKFLGFTETGTVSPQGLSTGLDSIKELGVTHVHLLPVFDYGSIDETKLDEDNYNWGYDPQNYNVPEGSYATNPYCGYTRIKEFKQMVKTLHDNNISVIMDVVFNHTYKTEDSIFNLTFPQYYYRLDKNGNYANGSATGNETASERAMVNKYIVDSIKYWAKEYNIDGFRFDLMGLHDTKLMKDIRDAVDKIDKSIIVYGEGWEAGGSPLDKSKAALKTNAHLVPEKIGFFNDDIRDGVKGHVFESDKKGFISGNFKATETVKSGIVASTKHPQINYTNVSTKKPWAVSPMQSVTYMSAHDNLTLWDKLKISTGKGENELLKMNKLSAVILFTSQGIPFFQAGEELAKTKYGNENSYKSSDSINQIKWSNKKKYVNLFNYYKGLISLRKAYSVFRLRTTNEVAQKLVFLETEEGVIAYLLENKIAVILNAKDTHTLVKLPMDNWVLVVDGESAGVISINIFKENEINVPPKTAYVLINKESFKKYE